MHFCLGLFSIIVLLVLPAKSSNAHRSVHSIRNPSVPIMSTRIIDDQGSKKKSLKGKSPTYVRRNLNNEDDPEAQDDSDESAVIGSVLFLVVMVMLKLFCNKDRWYEYLTLLGLPIPESWHPPIQDESEEKHIETEEEKMLRLMGYLNNCKKVNYMCI